MEDNKFSPPPASPHEERQKPIVLISQLLNQISNLRHVDEAFLWLCRAMGQYLGVSTIQFWAPQLDAQGNSYLLLRADASHLFSPSHPVYANKQIETVVQRLLREERSALSLPIEQAFPTSLVNMLKQHNIHFLSDYFLRYPAYLPVPQKPSSVSYIPTALTLVVAFFTPQPLTQDQVRDIHFMLSQSMRILASRQFVLQAPPTSVQKTPGEQPSIPFSQIIAHRSDNMEEVQAVNPFTAASTIGDKRARRFYAAIDGARSVADIASQQRLNSKDVRIILHLLLHQKKIVLQASTGEPLDHALFNPPML
ncbi:hypothetical protein KDH_78690 [Dictyobacter sp. S3.2.2.5]|uniref:GAF domain-containing protein n=1 Tax=Dictyobacter halimunensis TaxID=3026934 RepID=A0ABQ6G597_9CHLR|nr:hypothetical protein KDH_78690 [Dictyobacter sp. S3.2.2.5]